MTTREEKILVLYASQTGNSEQAAEDMVRLIPEKLSPERIQQLTGTKDTITLSARHMQLDDLLEYEKGRWTRLVIIIMSSYGIGQAPLGGYRFREFCDAIVEQKKDGFLDGLSFALLGLGDSKFTTFFQNPTRTNEALKLAGARRVGALGQADASGEQLEAISQWMSGVWPALAAVVVQDPLPEEKLETIYNGTLGLCHEIFPDMAPPSKSKQSLLIAAVAATPVLFAVGRAVFVAMNNSK